MRQTHLQIGDQELVLALLTSILLLPFLAGLVPCVLAFLSVIAQLQWMGKMDWRKLGRRILAPLGFLMLSSLVLFWGQHDHVFDLFSRSVFASILLVLLSTILRAHQWFELAFHWRVDGILLTLSLLAFRWMQISEFLWKSMDKGWRMRAQVGGIAPSVKILGWRIARFHQLHEQGVQAMDLGWNARGLHPILQVKALGGPPFAWSRFLRYLLPAAVSYAWGTFMTRGLA